MKNYIIRIYRQDENDSNQVVGIVESVEEDLKSSFTSMDELVKLLCRQSPIGTGITEDQVKQAVKNGRRNGGPDWGEIRFEDAKSPADGETEGGDGG